MRRCANPPGQVLALDDAEGPNGRTACAAGEQAGHRGRYGASDLLEPARHYPPGTGTVAPAVSWARSAR